MKKIKLMALWANKTKDGDLYFSANLGQGKKIMIFKNGFKKTEREPDFQMWLYEEERAVDNQAKPQTDYKAAAANDVDIDVPF